MAPRLRTLKQPPPPETPPHIAIFDLEPEERRRRNIFYFEYIQRVAVPWNNLPQHIVLSENLSLFKRNYDKYILKQALD